MTLVRDDDRWLLPVDGCDVMQLWIDRALTLLLDRDHHAFHLRIGVAFDFVSATGAQAALDPANPAGLGPVLSCVRTEVTQAEAFGDGRLQIRFADGSVIRVPASPDHKGWDLSEPDP